MTPLSSFTTRIAPRVQSAPDVLIEQAVLDACIDFCERSLIVKATLDPIATKADTFEYDVDSPQSGMAVARIMRAWLGVMELRPWTEDQVFDPFAFASSVSGYTRPTGSPSFFNEPDAGTLGLYPTPDAVYTITIRAALKPLRNATSVPDVLYENWVNAIADGALARLYSMSGTEFLSPQLAVAHQGLYMQALNAALLESTRGRNRGEQRVRPVWV